MRFFGYEKSILYVEFELFKIIVVRQKWRIDLLTVLRLVKLLQIIEY
jgi:hypothetical protein